MISQPEYITPAMLIYLDDLDESRVIDMAGAAEYLIEPFGLSEHEAVTVLTYWDQAGLNRESG